MYRARIGLAAAAVVALLTLVVVRAVGSSLGDGAMRTVQGQTERALQAFPSLDLLRGIEQTNDTARMARDDELADVFAKPRVDEQRQAAFVAVEARNARLGQEGRRADLVAVVGANGHVVCRDLNMNALYDEDWKSRYPSVGIALNGLANKDLWNFDGHMYRVAAAPIRAKSGQVMGALVVGYVASASDAQSDKAKVGSDVSYLFDRKVAASSFKKQGGESAEEKALAAQLFDGAHLADPALNGQETKPFTVKLGGEEYLAAAGPLKGNVTKQPAAFVVLTSITAARAPIGEIEAWIGLLGLAGLLAAVAATVLTAVRFIQPLDKIEGGVAEVINGNRDYVFESPSPDYEGLANGLNVMLARLLGRPDPSDDEMGGASGRWQGELSVEDVTGSHASLDSQALFAEPEPQYLQRVWEEYQAARRETGEGTDGLAFDAFAAKLKKSETDHCAKLNCKAVRFKVAIKNGQTTLKPIPLH